ncbi:5858_t:CDS:2, partial [Scutellospora calospora]
MSKKEFLHFCYTSYHCYTCRNNFQCKQRKKEFTQKEREDLNKKDEISICCLCDKKHFRCKSKKCDMCCKRNACDSYPCKYCLDNGNDCKYTIIRSLEEFKSFGKYDLSAYTGQLEYTKEGKVHVQGYCQFEKKRNKTRKKICEILKDYTVWIPEEKVRGDSNENILYATKEYNPCDRHKKKRCKCHHGDNICEICNDKCPEKTKSRIEGLINEVGPFKFGNFRYLGEKKNEEFDAIIEGNEMLYEGATSLEVFKRNRGKVTYSSNYSNMGKIYRDVQEEKMNLKGDRFWRPFTVYIYGPSGSGKTGFVRALFGDELYDKPKKKRNGSNWWNKYKRQEIVLLDEFYTKIDWDDMVNILNDSICDLELKHKGFVPFLAKYVFLTNTKPPEEAYNFGQNGRDDDSNKRSFEQFERRLDIIIEFRGKWHNDISKRTTEIIFHKGDEQKFRDMEWDVEYNNDKYTVDEIVERGE